MLWFDEVSSTQDILKGGRFPFGTVVVANRQSKGRGRFGRVWYSQEGGLYLSLLLSATEFNEILPLPLVVGYSMLLMLEKEGFSPMLKWVNDVYIKGKKVCGVLVERSMDRLIVGIGVNLNQRELPAHLNAVSLYMLSSRTSDKRAFLLDFLDIFNKVLEEYIKSGFKSFKDRIKEKLLFFGQEVVVQSDTATAGIFEDIDWDGGLLLRTADGIVKFTAGEVSLRGLYVP
ncbi:biotin--[acetyl-CoA-carboxylase] ligase [Thermocrinis sp.]|uniref:biotin--[acetyl-CoA-carboxylase] ligase n=1 Tax=Thermocrinis sp. TaxID=2024383 RepID=UPI002FDDE7B7